ncbi:MAG: hypothetical protein K8S98_14605 [Planctomycetes bacterium]|nr:hypothetical protein [Planctomycetota bacterium]
MKAATLRFVLTPLAIAAVALGVREALRELPTNPTPGHGTPLVPEALIALLAKRLPADVELAVDTARSTARLSSDDATSEMFSVAGKLVFDAEGELTELSLELASRESGVSAVVLRTLACSVRATPVEALRAAAANARFTRGTRACDTELDVRWSALPDGSTAVQGECAVPCAAFDLPRGAWTTIFRTPPQAVLAFDLVLTRRD